MTIKRGSGKRHPLLLYTRMLDRWWPALLFIGLGMLALAWPFYADLYTRLTQPWRWMTLATVGGLVIATAFLMLILRKSAYVQALGDHFRLVTPFLRLKISYRRIRRVNSAAVSSLFPPRSLRGMKRDILEPLFSQTAVVIDLNAMPVSMSTLRLFLSPFFFKDGTPHIVILVRDWMGFSTELETLRNGAVRTEWAPVPERAAASVLSQLPPRK
ncbi:MAG TPA: hypothetical protein VFH29_00785 [Anaerolineales bacterium]|nr:hypothetical protein [Anaerolineales bacterium]